MSYTEGSLGAMLQGVSQQPARLRAEGQVTEQINYESDVSTGLSSRPGSDEIAELVGATEAMTIVHVGHVGSKFLIGHAAGELAVWDTNGAAYAVSAPPGLSYIGGDMVFRSDAAREHVKVVNREVTVARESATTATWPFEAALATCLGGLYLRTYSVTVSSGAAEETVSYTTPDGTTTGDAEKTSAAYIMAQLETAWNALTLSGGLTGCTVERHEGTLIFRHSSRLYIKASDSDSGDTIRYADRVVTDATWLPATAAHGFTVRVRGGASTDDDYFLRFESETTTTAGDGFGDPGVWRESANPTAQNDFDVTTMPHSLTLDTAAKTAVFDTIGWRPRRAGGGKLNPAPKFVGKAIRDIAIFEERLAMVAGDTLNMSRTDDTHDFWKSSATVSSAADPIEVRSTASNGDTLDWIVPFDRNLLLVSDPGSAQFLVRGGGLTPDNASMVLTTEYDVDAGVRPVSTGRAIMLPFKSGRYMGVNEFFTLDQDTVNDADPITAVQDRYIRGSLTGMQSAENFNRFSMTTGARPKNIWVYRYLWDANDRLQSAWYKMRFAENVRAHFYDAGNMYVVLQPAADANGAVLIRLDMDKVADGVGYHVTLDRKAEYTVTSKSVTVPFQDARVVQAGGCAAPGLYGAVTGTTDNGDGTYTLDLDADQCPNGATVICGQAVERALTPTMPVPRDFQGRVASSAKLVPRHFLIHLSSSPDVRAVRECPYREDREFYPRRAVMEDDPLDPGELGMRDYVLKVPWRERADRSTLIVSCEDARPDTILEIEWAGDLRGVRRRI